MPTALLCFSAQFVFFTIFPFLYKVLWCVYHKDAMNSAFQLNIFLWAKFRAPIEGFLQPHFHLHNINQLCQYRTEKPMTELLLEYYQVKPVNGIYNS